MLSITRFHIVENILGYDQRWKCPEKCLFCKIEQKKQNSVFYRDFKNDKYETVT